MTVATGSAGTGEQLLADELSPRYTVAVTATVPGQYIDAADEPADHLGPLVDVRQPAGTDRAGTAAAPR